MRKGFAIAVLTIGSFLLHFGMIRHVYTGDLIYYPIGVIILVGAGISLILIGTTIWGWKHRNPVFLFTFVVIGGAALIFGSITIIYDSILFVMPTPLSYSSILAMDYKELIIGVVLLLVASILVFFGTYILKTKRGAMTYLPVVLVLSVAALGIGYSLVARVHITDAYWFTSRSELQVNDAEFFYRNRYVDLRGNNVNVPIKLLRLKQANK